MSSVAQCLGQIGMLLNEVGPRAEGYAPGTLYVECAPMVWNDGKPKSRILGPYKHADEAHNYIAIKIERHKLANAAFHGEKGRPPNNDREYFGHPEFHYRLMTAEEYFIRYTAEITRLAQQAAVELHMNHEPELFWPAQDGVDPGIEDTDSFDEVGEEE